MSHTIRHKEKLLKRIRRIRGQVEAVERALETGKECSDVLHAISAARGAMNGLMSEVFPALETNCKSSQLDSRLSKVEVGRNVRPR